jgi:hypothetical protein
MSNRICIDYVTFNCLNSDGTLAVKNHGVIICDDYAKTYLDHFETFKEVTDYINEDNFLEVIKTFDEFQDVDEFTCSSICFCEKEYNWGDLKDKFDL